MDINNVGTTHAQNQDVFAGKLGFSNMSDVERRATLDAHKHKYNVQDDTGEDTLSFAQIVESHNRGWCNNAEAPDKEPPKELFNFELILNSRKFQVLLDTLLHVKKEEDLADYSEIHLKECLEKCAAYRLTCFCAYISAHKEYCKWKEYHKVWMATTRSTARLTIKNTRIQEKTAKHRKEIGTITKEEVDDWILCNHTEEYQDNERMMQYWEDNEEMFKEFRDTLKDRAMHLQSLLNKVKDHIAPRVSDGSEIR